jgi:CRISPR-associated protein Cas2
MTVLICNDVPPAIRGHLKRWFVEPRPNVFIATLNSRTHAKVMNFIFRHAPKDFGVLAISSASNCQGYLVERIGPHGKSGRKEVDISGIPLIAESWGDPDNCPF